MVKFGDFESIDVNNLLSLHILSDAASVREGSTTQDEYPVDDLDDMGWTLVTLHRGRKMSSHKESTKRYITEKMVRRPKTKTLSLHSKKKKIKVHHYQETPRPITFGEYLPIWLYTKFTCDDTKSLCCNVYEKEAKDATQSYQSSNDAPKSSTKVENPSCPSTQMLHIYLLESKMYVWPKSHSLTMIFYLATHFIIALYSWLVLHVRNGLIES